jgi:hypothetical protein
MSDIPTKTYPPSFLRAMIADHEAERQAATGLSTKHRGDNLLQVEAPELPGAAFAYNEAERAGSTPEASSAVETKGDTMSDITRFQILNDMWVRYDDHRAEVERLTVQRDAAEAKVERLISHVATLTVVTEQAKAAAAREEAETDRVVADGNKALAEVERLTAERDEVREKLTRVQVQYDEFAKVTARVIDNHQRERDHARQQAYLLREAGADRPTDEDIWREAFMALCGQSLKEGYMIRAESADAALAVYRQRWPR